MHQEKYILTWDSYSDHLKSMMKELMMNEDFSDVTLVTEDKRKIKANVNILSACSPVFKDILTKGKNTNQIMYLRGVQFSEMESILQFIHLGEATLCNGRMEEFLAVAKSLEIKELCNAKSETDNSTETNTDEDDDPSTVDQVTIPEVQTTQNDTDKKVMEELARSSAPYNCEECAKEGMDYSPSVQSLFEGHIKVKHPFYQPFKCEKCDFKSNRKANVNRHVIRHHKN